MKWKLSRKNFSREYLSTSKPELDAYTDAYKVDNASLYKVDIRPSLIAES